MPDDGLRNAWHARERAIPLSTVPNFASEGLVLGVGTVLLRAEGARRLQALAGQDARMLALLSAAYGRALAPAVLGNIERAAKAWREGDDCLAYIHLAHARLGELEYPCDAAERLVIVDAFLKAGGSPRIVFEALKAGLSKADAFEKFYNPNEPRVPAGSGRTSGQWTRLFSALANLTEEAAESLGRFALRLLGPELTGAATVGGLLFIPSPEKSPAVEGQVPELPGLRYSWNSEEGVLHLIYDSAQGEQSVFAHRGDDTLRDQRGRIIGVVMPNGTVAIEPSVAFPDIANDNDPNLCPIPGPDRASGALGRGYENYVKSVVNPPNLRTPSGWGFQLPNPQDLGALVYYDDCQHATGMMVEAKGPGYDGLLNFDEGTESVIKEWWYESGRQISASGSRPVRWYFAELDAALEARQLFADDKEGGRERIEVVYLPWSRGQ